MKKSIVLDIYGKFKKIFILLLITFFTLSCNVANAKGRFIELNLNLEDPNQPVALNDNEIFFPGGWDGNNINKTFPARIYNVKQKKFKSLGVSMNILRSDYGAIKYDDNNILIVGGFCRPKNGDRYEYCSHVAEIYNISENKFIRISDTNLSYRYRPQVHLLDNDKIFILYNGNFEIFDTKTKKFFEISKLQNKPRVPIKDKYYYTANYYASIHTLKLNGSEILIYGYAPVTSAKIMEIFNAETREARKISVDEDVNFQAVVKIDDGSVLFIGRKNVFKFDPKKYTFTKINELENELAGDGILLNNGNIYIGYGALTDNDYSSDTSLLHAIYDYKNNKIYHRKVIYDTYYKPYFISLNNSLFIVGYKNTKSMIYKY